MCTLFTDGIYPVETSFCQGFKARGSTWLAWDWGTSLTRRRVHRIVPKYTGKKFFLRRDMLHEAVSSKGDGFGSRGISSR